MIPEILIILSHHQIILCTGNSAGMTVAMTMTAILEYTTACMGIICGVRWSILIVTQGTLNEQRD